MRASFCLVLTALLCARGDDFDDVDGDPYDLLGVAYDATSEVSSGSNLKVPF